MRRAAIAVPLFAAALAAALAAQQPAQAPAPAQPATVTPGRYVGVASCTNSGCHGATQPLNATHVLQNEFYTWLNEDRHAQAYNILFSDRSARIARNMRLKGKAYQENLCLDCHTTNVPANLIAGAVDASDGVQCEVCHGPASGWRNEHTEEGWTHAQSVSRGMIDLRSLNARATVCSGCHVGTARKEVDHELIASGHPVLAFELDNYEESMPPHWALKYEGGRDTHGVRAWAVGQVVKFRESLDNLSRHARGEQWPEFSDMSCYNCHHALANSGWRQQRGWPDRAGLPAWSPQHWAMLRLLIGRVSTQSRDELDPLVRQIARGVSRMNDPQGVAASADRARRIVDALVPKVDAMRWSDADIRTVMSTIASDRELILTSDVHAAEQAALALQSLSSALTRRNPRLLRGPMTRAIDALFDDLQNRDAYDPERFAEKLAAVKAAL
ncbi:MAG: cytochrome c family protein [Acidobacteriota bacterium]|nr:cytochrome c family protein [Acidobacteriota bacterium]